MGVSWWTTPFAEFGLAKYPKPDQEEEAQNHYDDAAPEQVGEFVTRIVLLEFALNLATPPPVRDLFVLRDTFVYFPDHHI
jgi:hypothetical protein